MDFDGLSKSKGIFSEKGIREMLSEKDRATVLPAAPRYGNINKLNNTTRTSDRSSPKLKNQISELLLHLHNPFLCPEYRQTLRLFESALRKYLAVKPLVVQV